MSISGARKRLRSEAELPYSMVNNPQHWRECAEEVRAMVDNINDPGAKQTLLKVAAGYDEMARKAEQRIIWTRPSTTSLSNTAKVEPPP
jgi:hypothetical protein